MLDNTLITTDNTNFLLKLFVLDRTSIDDWIYFHPVNGGRNHLVPTFSEEDEDECFRFEIRTDWRDRVPAMKNYSIIQAPYDFRLRTKKIHTSPSLHFADCGFAYTVSCYASLY